MMLRFSCLQEEAARAVEGAVRRVIASGLRTADIHTPETTLVETAGMGDAIVAAI
jgi:3-isopropylmalate dehydrogenase